MAKGKPAGFRIAMMKMINALKLVPTVVCVHIRGKPRSLTGARGFSARIMQTRKSTESNFCYRPGGPQWTQSARISAHVNFVLDRLRALNRPVAVSTVDRWNCSSYRLSLFQFKRDTATSSVRPPPCNSNHKMRPLLHPQKDVHSGEWIPRTRSPK